MASLLIVSLGKSDGCTGRMVYDALSLMEEPVTAPNEVSEALLPVEGVSCPPTGPADRRNARGTKEIPPSRSVQPDGLHAARYRMRFRAK